MLIASCNMAIHNDIESPIDHSEIRNKEALMFVIPMYEVALLIGGTHFDVINGDTLLIIFLLIGLEGLSPADKVQSK